MIYLGHFITQPYLKYSDILVIKKKVRIDPMAIGIQCGTI